MAGVKFREHDKNETLLALGIDWHQGEAVYIHSSISAKLQKQLHKPPLFVIN